MVNIAQNTGMKTLRAKLFRNSTIKTP